VVGDLQSLLVLVRCLPLAYQSLFGRKDKVALFARTTPWPPRWNWTACG